MKAATTPICVVLQVHLLAEATRVFGNKDRASAWLQSPKHRFQSRTPLEMLNTDSGIRMIEEMLGQIDEGMFA